MLSLQQAANQSGVAKSTIFRAIKSGKLSATRNDDGTFAIDPAELFRVFAPVPAQQSEPVAAQQSETALVAQLEREIAVLRDLLARADRTAEQWREAHMTQLRALSDGRGGQG
jgi:hypothetical protein